MAEFLAPSEVTAELFDPYASALPPPAAQQEGQRAAQEWRGLLYALLEDFGVVNEHAPSVLIDSLMTLTEGPFNAGMILALANPEFAQRVALFQAGSAERHEYRLNESRKFYHEVQDRLQSLREKVAAALKSELEEQGG